MAIHSVQVPIGNPNYTISLDDGQPGPGVSHNSQDLIGAHCSDFYGFGDWCGQYWGIEHRRWVEWPDGANISFNPPTVAAVMAVLRKLGDVLACGITQNNGLADRHSYENLFNGNLKVFLKPALRLDALMRVILGQRYGVNERVPPAVLKDYRQNRYMVTPGENAMLYLLPCEWLSDPALDFPRILEDTYLIHRLNHIAEQIKWYVPKLVLMFGVRKEKEMNIILKTLGQPSLGKPLKWQVDQSVPLYHQSVQLRGQTVHFCVAHRPTGEIPGGFNRYFHHVSHFLFTGALNNGQPLFA